VQEWLHFLLASVVLLLLESKGILRGFILQLRGIIGRLRLLRRSLPRRMGRECSPAQRACASYDSSD
jgi:hypothetical protein